MHPPFSQRSTANDGEPRCVQGAPTADGTQGGSCAVSGQHCELRHASRAVYIFNCREMSRISFFCRTLTCAYERTALLFCAGRAKLLYCSTFCSNSSFAHSFAQRSFSSSSSSQLGAYRKCGNSLGMPNAGHVVISARTSLNHPFWPSSYIR